MTENEILNIVCDNIDLKYKKMLSFELKKSQTTGIFFITVKAEPSYWRLDSNEKTLAKIKIGKKSSYIAFNTSCEKLLKQHSISYNKIKSENMLRVSIEDFSQIPVATIGNLFTNIMLNAFNFQAFGCCGKFNICEKTGICVHDDVLYSTACQYRKIITKL